MSRRINLFAALLFISILVSFLAYQLGIGGPFLFDDFHNLSGIGLRGGIVDFAGLMRYVFDISGTDYGRSLARLTFALDDQFWPSIPVLFKSTNIAIHLINGLLIALFLLRLLPLCLEDKKRAAQIALLCAALWLLHPLHVSTTLYVVQRMTQLMMLFSLLSLLFFLQFRQAQSVVAAIVYLVVSAFSALLAFLAKENAATLLLLFALVEWVALSHVPGRFRRFSRWLTLAMLVLFVVIFAVMAVQLSVYFEARDYSAWQRFLVQGKVLFDYLLATIFPGVNNGGIYNDDLEWQIRHHGVGLSGLYWLLHVALIAGCWRFWGRRRVLMFGLLWFYLGNVIESTVLPLELKYEHRTYLPSMGIILIIAYGLVLAYGKLKQQSRTAVAVAIVIAPLVFCAINLAHRAALWSDYRILIYKWSNEHPNSLRSQYALLTMMEHDGFEDKSLKLALELEDRFDDLILPMYRVRIECEYNLGGETDDKLDLNRFAETPYSSGVATELRAILYSRHADCIAGKLINGDLTDLVKVIGKMPQLKSRPRYHAQYLDIAGKYYMENRLYEDSVRTLELLWEVQPSTATALKLAELFILGGNTEQAAFYLDWAEAKSQLLWYRDPRLEGDINNLKLILEPPSSTSADVASPKQG